jgi:hypothetical protein
MGGVTQTRAERHSAYASTLGSSGSPRRRGHGLDETHVEEATWPALARTLESIVVHVLTQHRFPGTTEQGAIDGQNVIAQVMARLREHGFHRLAVYRAAKRLNPRLMLRTWLRVVVKRAWFDYMRTHSGHVAVDEPEGRRCHE